MAIEIESDATRLAMLRAVGAKEYTAPSGTLTALLEQPFGEAALGPGVEGDAPSLTCRTSDVERLQLGKGVILVQGDQTYRIVRHEPDGTGMSRVIVQ